MSNIDKSTSTLEGPDNPAVSRAIRARSQRSTVYGLLTFAALLGVLLGVLGALGELDSPSMSHPATIVAMVSCVPVLLMIASLLKDVFGASRLRDTLDYSDTAATGNEADIIDDIGEAKVGGEDGPADEH